MRRIAGVLIVYALTHVLGLLAWWLIGRGALDGVLDRGWLFAWALLLSTQVLLQAFVNWKQPIIAVDAGRLLKQRLLAGALRLAPEEIGTQGAGLLLGRVLESNEVESLALGAGFLGAISMIELVSAGVVLGLGAAAAVEVPLLCLWVLLAVVAAQRYFAERRGWTEARVAMTHDLVERMVGHRTRLAQQLPERWHDGEDDAVASYLARSASMDRRAARLTALLPGGWLVLGLCVLAPAFVGVLDAKSSPAVAIAMAGVILAYRALRKLVLGLASFAGAAIAWQQVRPLFEAAERAEHAPAPEAVLTSGQSIDELPILEGRELSFRYGARPEPTLSQCSIAIHRGDRILLQGRSGGGKSTLGSLLCGLREPTSGLLLLDGLDRSTLGLAGWRAKVAASPQFHQNHVLSATFAFNLLMGRRWPPTRADREEAETICRELGLGQLLERMPAGLLQIVGETGWQLSHGERSRLFIARSLLQSAEVVIFDESFAALDPETVAQALACVHRRAKTLVVIAHP